MKTATMILAAGFLSVSATAHAQGVAPGATAPGAAGAAANQTALMNSMMNSMSSMIPKMDGQQLDLMLAEIVAKMKAGSGRDDPAARRRAHESDRRQFRCDASEARCVATNADSSERRQGSERD